MAQLTVRVSPGGSVDVQPVRARRRDPATGAPDQVQWIRVGPQDEVYVIVFPAGSPFVGDTFSVPTGFLAVRDDASVGLPGYKYDVRTAGGAVLVDPDVIIE